MDDPLFRRRPDDETDLSASDGTAYMNRREEDEFLVHYGSRKERRAIRARRKAKSQAANDKAGEQREPGSGG